MIDWELVWKIGGPIVGAVVGILGKHFLEARPKVVAFLQHANGVPLRNVNPPTAIGTHSVVIRNDGRAAATNIRLGHSELPAYVIFPDIEHTIGALPGGGQEIRIPLLIRNKQITITYVYTAPLQWQGVNTHLESDAGAVTVLNVFPLVQPPRWVRRTLWTFAVTGLATFIYLAVALGRSLALVL